MKPITIALFASTATASRVTESEAPHLNAEVSSSSFLVMEIYNSNVPMLLLVYAEW